MNNYD